MMTLILLFIVGSLFLLSRVTLLFFKQTRKPNTQPSQPKLPILGDFHQLGSQLDRSLHKLSQQHGPLMLLYFGHIPILIISSADAAHGVMKFHDIAFASRPPSSMAMKLLYGYHDVAFDPYGKYWRQEWRISVLQLLSLKRVQSFNNVMQEEVKLMVQKNRSGTQPVNMCKIINAFTNDIVCRVAFGRKYSPSTSGSRAFAVLLEFNSLLGRTTVGDIFLWLSWVDTLSGLNATGSNIFRQLDAFVEEAIGEHVKNVEGSKLVHEETMDFVNVLLSMDAKEGSSLSKMSVGDIFLKEGSSLSKTPVGDIFL